MLWGNVCFRQVFSSSHRSKGKVKQWCCFHTWSLNKSMVLYLLSTLQMNYHLLALERQWRRSHWKAFHPSLSRDRLEHKPEEIKIALPYYFIWAKDIPHQAVLRLTEFSTKTVRNLHVVNWQHYASLIPPKAWLDSDFPLMSGSLQPVLLPPASSTHTIILYK